MKIFRTDAGYVVEHGGPVRRLVGISSATGRPAMRSPADSSGQRLLAPVMPGKIVAVALNYKAHAAEQGKPLPPEPLFFLKPRPR